jgi:G:T-mismatch repair DNA endonuclease (very short patch repair protein)
MTNICSIDVCNNKHQAKGFCDKHYRKWRRHGDPLGIADPKKTAEKISNALTGIPKSVKHRKNLSKSVMGRPSPRKGVTLLDSSKEKISKANKGRISPFKGVTGRYSKDTIALMSKSKTGKKDSPETRKIKSIAHNKPETLELSRIRGIEVQSRPDVKAKHSKSLKITYNTPKGKEIQRERRKNQILPSKDSKIELQTQKILTDAGIEFEKHIHVSIAEYKEHGLPPTKEVDILINSDKIIEVNGYYHFDPRTYHSNQEVRMRNKTITPKEVWDKEEHVLKQLRKSGHEILVVWDLDLKKDLEKTTKKILKFVKS